MSQKRIDFKAALVDLIDEARDPAVSHPEDDELRQFQLRQLPVEEAERLRGHLLTCRECFARLRELDSPAPPETGADFELAAFWRGLWPRVAAEEADGPGAPADPEQPTVTSPPARILPLRTAQTSPPAPATASPRRFPLALAATFLTATLGLSLWIAIQNRALQDQRRTLHELTQPQGNVPILDLSTASARGAGAGELVEAKADEGFLLVLTPAQVTGEGTCTLRILDAAGREVRTVSGLARNSQDATFSLWLPRGALAAGDYQLELRDATGHSETFRLRIGPPA